MFLTSQISVFERIILQNNALSDDIVISFVNYIHYSKINNLDDLLVLADKFKIHALKVGLFYLNLKICIF
jgi:hypothetical protein